MPPPFCTLSPRFGASCGVIGGLFGSSQDRYWSHGTPTLLVSSFRTFRRIRLPRALMKHLWLIPMDGGCHARQTLLQKDVLISVLAHHQFTFHLFFPIAPVHMLLTMCMVICTGSVRREHAKLSHGSAVGHRRWHHGRLRIRWHGKAGGTVSDGITPAVSILRRSGAINLILHERSNLLKLRGCCPSHRLGCL